MSDEKGTIGIDFKCPSCDMFKNVGNCSDCGFPPVEMEVETKVTILDHLEKFWKVYLGIIGLSYLLFWGIVLLMSSEADPAAIMGTSGDFLGGLFNPLLSFLTIYLLLMSMKDQRQALKDSREELKLSREELILTRKEFEESNETQKKHQENAEIQRFEQGLALRLENYRAAKESTVLELRHLPIPGRERLPNQIGGEAIHTLHKQLKNRKNLNSKDVEPIKHLYEIIDNTFSFIHKTLYSMEHLKNELRLSLLDDYKDMVYASLSIAEKELFDFCLEYINISGESLLSEYLKEKQ